MKKLYIMIFVVLSLHILSLCCIAQGSVNSNNALGEPGVLTNDPGSDTNMATDPITDTENGMITDNISDTVSNTDTNVTTPGTTANAPSADTGSGDSTTDKGMTAVIVLIIVAAAVAVVAVIVLLTKKSRRD